MKAADKAQWGIEKSTSALFASSLPMFKYLDAIKSLGFGGMLGGGFLGLLCISFPQAFLPNTSVYFVVVLGAFLGAGAHRAIEMLLAPLATLLFYYSRLIQVILLHRLGILNQKQTKRLIDQLSREYFTARKRQ